MRNGRGTDGSAIPNLGIDKWTQTSESLVARGSNIILLWESHVSLLTMCPFVKDMANDHLVQKVEKLKELMIFGAMKKSPGDKV